MPTPYAANQMLEGHSLDNTDFSDSHWRYIQSSDDATQLVPAYGRRHRLGASCWCCPTINKDFQMVLHNVEM